MKILVCVKQVPDSADTLDIDGPKCWISPSTATVFRMNRYDEFALEEALLIKEKIPGTVVHAVSVGPERARSTVRRALEMGADHGIHILSSDETYTSPFNIASLIASFVNRAGYDLTLTGVMSEDMMACQTGQLVAAILNIPCSTSVIGIAFSEGLSSIEAEREIEGGARLSVRMEMPAVLTIQSGINTPRYPRLSHFMRARNYEQEVVMAVNLAQSEMREACTSVRVPDPSSMGMFIEGTPREKARMIMNILHDKSFLP